MARELLRRLLELLARHQLHADAIDLSASRRLRSVASWGPASAIPALTSGEG
jgi:hypothetical protein